MATTLYNPSTVAGANVGTNALFYAGYNGSADLQGLYGAILTRGQVEFTKKIIAKQAVDAATTSAAVQAVTL